jgi:hypothetical protein
MHRKRLWYSKKDRLPRVIDSRLEGGQSWPQPVLAGSGRLKGGCGQDCPPSKCERHGQHSKTQLYHTVLPGYRGIAPARVPGQCPGSTRGRRVSPASALSRGNTVGCFAAQGRRRARRFPYGKGSRPDCQDSCPMDLRFARVPARASSVRESACARFSRSIAAAGGIPDRAFGACLGDPSRYLRGPGFSWAGGFSAGVAVQFRQLLEDFDCRVPSDSDRRGSRTPRNSRAI